MQREDGKQIIVLNDRPQPLGAWLAVQRKRLNLTLGDLANAARIRRNYLEAIEAGDYKALPGRAYAFAFVRTYAQYVGLDPEEATERLRVEISATPSAREITISRPAIDAGLLRIAGLAAIVLVPLMGLGLWLMGGTSDGELPPSVPVAPRVIAEAPPIPGRAPRIDPPPPAAFVAPAVPNAGPGAALATPFSPPPAQGAPQVDPAPTAPPPAAQRPSPPQNQNALGLPAPRIAIRAQAPTHITIRDAAGVDLFARQLRQGERFLVPNLPGLVLTSTRLNNLEIQVDNWILPPQGRGNRRELALEPDRLLTLHGVPLAQRGQLRRDP